MLTFENRVKRIVQTLGDSFSDADIKWVCAEFWRETDIAMRKHILVTLLRAKPRLSFDDVVEMLCRFSMDVDRDRRIVREVYEWSLLR